MPVKAPSIAPITRSDVVAECDRLPLPGDGRSRVRWDRLIEVARRDLALAKLVEPHHDAVAILSELDGPSVQDGQIWAVWAAEPPFAMLRATEVDGGWRLTGRKAFCSGAALVTHALVTAETPAGPGLFAVDLDDVGVVVDADAPTWVAPGMSRAQTVTLALHDVSAQAVGRVGEYTDRVGFWLGAIGIAACWFGGALGVADLLESGSGRLGPHGLAHLGAVRSGTETFALALDAAAAQVDAGLDVPSAQRLALVLRARAADLADEVVGRVGRASGPGPLAFDEAHARRVADLTVFVRQHHAERDLETLGAMS